MRRRKERHLESVHFGCANHPSEPSVGTCTKCEHNVCETCRLEVGDTTYCLRCAWARMESISGDLAVIEPATARIDRGAWW